MVEERFGTGLAKYFQTWTNSKKILAEMSNHSKMGKFRRKTPCLPNRSAKFLQREESVLRELYEGRG